MLEINGDILIDNEFLVHIMMDMCTWPLNYRVEEQISVIYDGK